MGKIYARSSSEKQQHENLFKAWMWVVSPRDKALPSEGAAKGEELQPYAPGVFAAMLGDVPAWYVRLVVDVDLGIDLNERDIHLAELEETWFKRDGEDTFGYFVIPLYFHELPLFCVVAKFTSGKPWPPQLVYEILRYEKERLYELMEKNWSDNAWERFLREALTEINECVLVDLLDAVDKDRSWKSWLEALPGEELKKKGLCANSGILLLKNIRTPSSRFSQNPMF